MDRLEEYRTLVKRLLSYYANLINNRLRGENSNDETFVVFDGERDHYMIMTWGWAGKQRVRDADVYIRLKNNKLWIEEDGLEDGIATDLMEAGVPKQDIVLAFHQPRLRPLTEFAVS